MTLNRRTLCTLAVSEVMRYVEDEGCDKVMRTFYDANGAGHEVQVNKKTLNVFKHSGTNCIRCGLKGLYFKIERIDQGRPSLFLYGVDSAGEEVLMTKDHIIPKSWGGQDVMANFQTMCRACNIEKANRLPEGSVVVATETWDEFRTNCAHHDVYKTLHVCNYLAEPKVCYRVDCPRTNPKNFVEK